MSRVVKLILGLLGVARVKIWYVRGYILKLYLSLYGCKVGKRLKCKQWPVFRSLAYKSIVVGDDVSIGYRITLETVPGGIIRLENSVQLTQDILISARELVHLGEYVGIAEYVSIRDSDHEIKRGIIPHRQGHIVQKVAIARGAGVGRGCAILRGSQIAEGALIGANTIIMRGFVCVENGIYFGNPPRLIGIRR